MLLVGITLGFALGFSWGLRAGRAKGFGEGLAFAPLAKRGEEWEQSPQGEE